MGLTARIAGVVRDENHGQALLAAGATRVINPFLDAADHAAQMITDALNLAEDLTMPCATLRG